jgi:hypothetical protein
MAQSFDSFGTYGFALVGLGLGLTTAIFLIFGLGPYAYPAEDH